MKTIMYNSISLDGSFTNFDIDMGIHYQVAGRFHANASLIGSETVRTGIELYGGEIPAETESDFTKPDRDPNLPYWIIVDTGGKTSGLLHTCRRFEFCKDIIVLVSRRTTADFIDYLKERAYEYVVSDSESVDFEKAFELLGNKYGIHTIMIDSGPMLNSVLLRKGLIDEISLLVSPVLVGVRSDKMLGQLITGDRNVDLELLSVEEIDKGLVLLRYQVLKP